MSLRKLRCGGVRGATSLTQLTRGHVAAPGLLGPPPAHCPPATAPQSPSRAVCVRSPVGIRAGSGPACRGRVHCPRPPARSFPFRYCAWPLLEGWVLGCSVSPVLRVLCLSRSFGQTRRDRLGGLTGDAMEGVSPPGFVHHAGHLLPLLKFQVLEKSSGFYSEQRAVTSAHTRKCCRFPVGLSTAPLVAGGPVL